MAANLRLEEMDEYKIVPSLREQIAELEWEQLENIWKEIGISRESQKVRSKCVKQHVKGLLKDMIDEEITLQNRLMNDIKTYTELIKSLCKELDIPQYKPQESLSILKCEKDLRTKAASFHQEKHDRLTALKELKEKENELCKLMKMEQLLIADGIVPSKKQIETLEKRIQTLSMEKEKRYNEFVETKKQILIIMDEIDQSAKSPFEHDVVFGDKSFTLSEENMEALAILYSQMKKRKEDVVIKMDSLRDRLSVLWKRLDVSQQEMDAFLENKSEPKQTNIEMFKKEIERCEQMKHAHMEKVISRMRQELSEWWQTCCISFEERAAFGPYTSGENTDEVLEALEEEIKRLKNYYTQNETLFTKLKHWHQLWADFVEFERLENDPKKYNNRGGALLQQQKAKAKATKELGKVEKDLQQIIDEWEQQENQPFNVCGMSIQMYMKEKREEHQEEKDREKEQRAAGIEIVSDQRQHKTKAKITKEEMLYGSKPVCTPRKRACIQTPSLVNSKCRKTNITHRTPGHAVSRINFCSPFAEASQTPKSLPRSGLRSARNRTTPLKESNWGNVTRAAPCTETYKDFENGLNIRLPNCRSSTINQEGKVPTKSATKVLSPLISKQNYFHDTPITTKL